MNGIDKPVFMIVNLLKYRILNRIYTVLSYITNFLKNDFQLNTSLILTVISSFGLNVQCRFYYRLFPDYMGIEFHNERKYRS